MHERKIQSKSPLIANVDIVDLYQYSSNKESLKSFAEKISDGTYKIIDHDCPICGNHSNWLSVAKTHEGFCWSICKECGLFQINKRFRHADLNAFYSSGEYHKLCMGDLDNEKHFDLYLRIAETGILADLKLLGISVSGIKLLDIGCGPGATLLAIKNAGADVAGYDMDPERIAFGKKYIYEIEYGDAFDFNRNFDEFDLILINGVLEHLHDPMEFLYRLSEKISNHDVLLLIHVPNLTYANDYSAISFTKFMHIGHIWYFTPASLERALNHAGFVIKTIVPRGPNMGVLCSKHTGGGY